MTNRRLIVCLLLIAGCGKTPETPELPRLDWQPELDQPARQLEEILTTTEQQQPLNYTSANLGFVLDAKLFVLFQRFTEQLPAAQRPAAIEKQRQWLQSRKEAAAAAAREYEGGSLAPYSANQAFIEATKRRITELEKEITPPAK